MEESGPELVLNHEADTRVFPVSAYTLGYLCNLSHGNGTQFTIDNRPDTLDRYYGDDLGYDFEFFLRIHPSLHTHGQHDHAHHIAGMEK